VLWNLVDPGAELTTVHGHDNLAADVAYSPDGTMLASAGADKLVKLWRVSDGQQVGQFRLDSGVRRVAFSPDGATLATASQDTAVRLWDVRGGQLLARLDRHGDDLNDVAFDHGGRLVVSASADGSARIWDLDPDHAVRMICGTLDHDTLADEWRALGPDRGNPPSCPN
jgi:WD40 repeat protein